MQQLDRAPKLTSLDLRPHSSSILYWILDTQVERMRVESEKWQSDYVFRIMLWSDEKSKIQIKSKEIQKSYRAFKMQENRLSVNQILMQPQAFAEKVYKNQSCCS